MDTKGGKWLGGGGGVMNWEIGIDIYTLICIKWITNTNLLYKKINKIKFKKKIRALRLWRIHLADREGRCNARRKELIGNIFLS